MRNSLLTPPTLAALALTLARPAAAAPIVHSGSLYNAVDEDTGETVAKGLPSGVIVGVVIGAVLGFGVLFGLLWCWLDRQAADRHARHPTRRRSSERDPHMRERSASATRTNSTSTTASSNSRTTESSGRTAVGTFPSAKPSPPASPSSPTPPSPRIADRVSRMYTQWRSDGADDLEQQQRRGSEASEDSLPQYVQVHPPPRAHLAGAGREREKNARIGKWVAKIEGREKEIQARPKSWAEGDPEKQRPDPFTA